MIAAASNPPADSPLHQNDTHQSSSPSSSLPSSRTPNELKAIAHIAFGLKTFTADYPPQSTIEIRAVGCTARYKPKPHVIAGFFSLDNIDAAANAAFDLQRQNARGVYFTLNPVNIDLLSRRANRVEAISERDSISALDTDILCRRWMLIDADPVRTSGISSSVSEKESARSSIVAIECRLSMMGWPYPVIADSGNGWHLLYKIDVPSTDDGLIRNCLRALASQFNNTSVTIDTTVYNPARICKVYGTVARKGDHTSDRPHRFAEIVTKSVNENVTVVPLDLLQQLAAMAPPEKSHAASSAGVSKGTSKGRKSRHSRRGDGSPRSVDPVKAAAAYLEKIPPAISGQGGHSQTYHAAGILIDGFALSIDDALPLLQSWNANCQPPWSDADLERKLLEAEKNLGRSGSLIPAESSVEFTSNARQVRSIDDLILITEEETHSHPPTGQSSEGGTPLSAAPATQQPPSTILIHPASSQLSSLTPSLIENRTDIANGRRMALVFGHHIRYFHSWKSWLTFTGTHWQRDATADVHRKAKQIAETLWGEAFSPSTPEAEIDDCIAFARYTSSIRGITEMLKAASSEPSIPVTADDLDSNHWDLNCPNGTLNLRTGELRGHSSSDLITKITATPYNPELPTPIWNQFLSDIFAGNTELIAYIQRLLGYCLTGDVSEHILPVLHGGGENGKSTLLNAVMEIIGNDYSMKANSDFLMAKYGDAHPTEKADLFGRRLVSASETKEGQKIDEALVKELTGGDNVRARRMREDFWEFRPTHKLLLTTNHRPVVSGSDRGIWRRMRLIPFNVTIQKEKKDKQLPEKLRTEYPGILAWMVQGCLAWQNGGLNDPNDVLIATSEYRQSQDVLQGFIDECCLVGAAYKVRSRLLFHEYKKWADDSGERTMSEKKFSAALTERGFRKVKDDTMWFQGICTKDKSEENSNQDQPYDTRTPDDPF